MNNILSLPQLRVFRVIERDLAHLVANVLQFSHHYHRIFLLHRLHDLVVLRSRVVPMTQLRRFPHIASSLSLVFLSHYAASPAASLRSL